MTNIYLTLGILSGLLIIVADIPYALDSLKGKTKPHRITWGTICLLNIIGIANQAASGAKGSLGLFIGMALATAVIFAISLFKGVGGHTKLDIACLIGAGLGLLLWYALKTPTASIIANLFVATFAMIPTLQKAYVAPGSETRITWLIGTLAACLGILAVNSSSGILYVMPVYAALSQLAVYLILVLKNNSGSINER